MAKLIILCGLPGSGKSTYALDYKAMDDAFGTDLTAIHSSDSIRNELFGDASFQGDNARVFELMHKRVKDDLRAGKTVIYDATNITRKARKGAINLAGPDDTVECHIIWADPVECRRRDSLRERSVGQEVIDKMLRRWQSPWIDEGFDTVQVFLNQADFNQVAYISSMTDNMHIPHDNPHHTLNVWDHCLQAYSNLEQIYQRRPVPEPLKMAAYWHDIGKPYTKFFKPGEDIAHYYDHHCVGGYLAYGLFLNTNHLLRNTEMDDICLISWIIANHMEGFCNSKYYKELNSQWKWYLEILHEADLSAH